MPFLSVDRSGKAIPSPEAERGHGHRVGRRHARRVHNLHGGGRYNSARVLETVAQQRGRRRSAGTEVDERREPYRRARVLSGQTVGRGQGID